MAEIDTNDNKNHCVLMELKKTTKFEGCTKKRFLRGGFPLIVI